MKKSIFLSVFVLMGVLMGCSSDDDSSNDNDNEGISNEQLSGRLYGVDYTANGGRADLDVVFEEDVVVIQLSDESLGCETGQFSGDFPISITAPRAVGTYDSAINVFFGDPNSDDFISVSGGIDMEIITLTETTVVFKIKVASSSTENNLEGRHEVTICE